MGVKNNHPDIQSMVYVLGIIFLNPWLISMVKNL
jgi:hypothetical protein